ncbi:hypothetical protein ACFXPM_03245 [Streptomyces sp. NPDC059095]|uniref:hypothetical protein n=1 Tax=Streptomyces sp. NPDC059095 TaxID=3346726 RepID=UPI00367824C6
MRPEVRVFVADGPLPDWDTDDDEEIDRRAKQIEAISRPVTVEEAHALATCFGPDDCYGVAWSLVHLIETGPGPVPPVTRPGPSSSVWQQTLWNRWGTGDPGDDRTS